MRENESRGKKLDNGDWAYGNLIIWFGNLAIGIFFIDPQTRGQYVEREDKNNKKIFKGDYVKCFDNYNKQYFEGYVDFQNCSFVIKNEICTHYRWIDYEVEVVGNIYDSEV